MKQYFCFIFIVFATFLGQAQDTDGDGLLDVDEAAFGCDINDPDSDDDGLLDGDEVYIYATNPSNDDTDYDDLIDGDEINIYATDPNNEDTDFDTLEDGYEVNVFYTDPLLDDSDNDGLKDGEEVYVYGTDPTDEDTDSGGGIDGDEIDAGLDPLDPSDDYLILAVDSFEKDSEKLFIYPTITNSKINVVDKLNKLNKIEIYNLKGQLISSDINLDDSIDVSNYYSGMYIIKLYTNNNYTTLKFIKK